LIRNPRSIDAVELNHSHFALANLKIGAVKHLPTHKDLFAMFGSTKDKQNPKRYYKHIAPNLDPITRNFWETSFISTKSMARINYFKKNFYNYGLQAKFLLIMKLWTILYRKQPTLLLHAKNMKEQKKIVKEHFIRSIFSRSARAITFVASPLFRSSLGIPPKQWRKIREEFKGNLSLYMKNRMIRLMCNHPVEDNYFVWQAVDRKYDTEKRKALPEYLKEENYKKIKRNVDRINVQLCSLHEYLRSKPANSFNCYNLLDAQDWMTKKQINNLWKLILKTAMPKSRILFRTITKESPIEKSLNPKLLKRFKYHQKLSGQLAKEERTGFYEGVHLYTLC
ncbi:DUF3419 family protein, partial [Candidatus Woesearchaeota archaeon]|nr:DUF3419 family protein [Candidatus Woesearchaeota archaeon]